MKSIGMPCFGAAPFPQAPFIVPGVSKLDTRDVLETLEEAASENDDETEAKQIKLRKLGLKDRMEAIARLHRQEQVPA